MADMSGKEIIIIKFAKNMPTCPIGMIMVSNHIVWSMYKTNLALRITQKLLSAKISAVKSK